MVQRLIWRQYPRYSKEKFIFKLTPLFFFKLFETPSKWREFEMRGICKWKMILQNSYFPLSETDLLPSSGLVQAAVSRPNGTSQQRSSVSQSSALQWGARLSSSSSSGGCRLPNSRGGSVASQVQSAAKRHLPHLNKIMAGKRTPGQMGNNGSSRSKPYRCLCGGCHVVVSIFAEKYIFTQSLLKWIK